MRWPRAKGSKLLIVNFLTFLVILACLTLAGKNIAAQTAIWHEPEGTPPNNNVPAPLNINTKFVGDNLSLEGGWDYGLGAMKLTLSGCNNANEVLKWDNDQEKWVCGEAQANNLLSVLQKSSDASEFTGNVLIGSETNGANLYLGGEFTSKWLHATAQGDNSILGNLGLGTITPRAKLHIFDLSKNAEIDLQSVDGEGNHWAIYHDASSNSLRFWNNKAPGDKNVISLGDGGKLGLGTVNPNSNLHIYDSSKNAEIDIQSGGGSNEHWAIYHDASSGDLRFWKDDNDGNSNNDNQVKINKQGIITAEDFCSESGKCLSGGLGFMGQTSQEFTGASGGYKGANAKCSAQYQNSHVCSTDEILALINKGLSPNSGWGWISNGPPGFPAIIPNYKSRVNDCNGWTNGTGDINGEKTYGNWWQFDSNGGRGYLVNCNVDMPFLCCH
ncbi:MAG: hypothetical protein WC518_00345 [Patescibacteria group bacterium]